MSVYVHQTALISAIGTSPKERKEALMNVPQLPEKLRFEFLDETVLLPYHPISAISVNQVGRLYLFIDQLMAEVLDEMPLSGNELKKTALFFGSTSYDLGQSIKELDLEDKPYINQLKPLSTIPNYIQEKYQIGGLSYAYNSACSSSANALHHAKLFLEAGIVDYALVVGCELYNPVSVSGFYSLQLLSSTACQPFTVSDGMVLGEAVGAVLLSNKKSLNEKECSSIELLSESSAVDFTNISGSNESGLALSKVMKACLQNNESSIAAIKCCGVGTSSADIAEANAIKTVFNREMPIMAFKPYLGNTLGASGVAELVLLKESIGFDILPNTLFTNHKALESLSNQAILLNNFGFGGNNVCQVVKHNAA